MNSAIYSGTICHRRFEPVEHEVTYRMFMVYLDLAELDRVFEGSWLFSANGKAPAEFRRADHLGDPGVPLDQAVRDLVESQTGERPQGPIRLLTHLRYFGYVFNPVSFYYCYDREDNALVSIVAEVNNTPWGERHCYVLPVETGRSSSQGDCPQSGRSRADILRFTPKKAMHVSPFMPMDVAYDWRFGAPGEHLNAHMSNLVRDQKMFDATLRLERREITPASLARSLAAFPFMTLRIIIAIHWQALRLWLKKCPVYDHPKKQRPSGFAEERTR
jgi:DUF1365 family protein